ncbi:MAG TPA: head GIN domain-containing protein [Tenuifilaceae bacterium]|jgi:hypothetical protein|nr:head GIN domain-containing protein [Tenuifilaceae bacterium]
MNKLIVFFTLVAITLASCDSKSAWDILKTAGKTVSEEREIEPFGKVELLDRVNLDICQDTAYKLILTGPKNLLPKISTRVEDGTLTIADNNSCNWVRDYEHRITAKVHVKQLNRIYYEGIGNITTTNKLTVDTLIIRSFQSAGSINLDVTLKYFHCYFDQSLVDLHIAGTANRVHAQINGTGFLYCHELITPHCVAFNQGSGDIYVYASNYLHGIIEGSGNVFYTGNPSSTEFRYIGRGSGRFVPF